MIVLVLQEEQKKLKAQNLPEYPLYWDKPAGVEVSTCQRSPIREEYLFPIGMLSSVSLVLVDQKQGGLRTSGVSYFGLTVSEIFICYTP